VRAVYDELARRPAERECIGRAECCHFKLTGLAPHVTRGEVLVAAKALRATGRKNPPRRDDGACPMLDAQTSRCIIYEARPFGCRTHFCRAAGGPYARSEVIDLVRRLEDVDRALDGDGAKPFSAAIEAALRLLR
jgi:Fe-S-cluster containining protein